jgi:hypothetical protein
MVMLRLRIALVVGAACFAAACSGGSNPANDNGNNGNDAGNVSNPDDAGTSAGGDAGLTGFFQIVSPASGTSVSDVFDLEVAVQDPSLVDKGVTISVDGTVAATTKTLPTEPISFDSSDFANGVHQIEISVTDSSGTTHRDSVSLTFANAPFQADTFTPSKASYKNGEFVDIDVSFTGDTSGLILTADFSELDSSYTTGAEIVSDKGDGTFTISYDISPSNTASDGIKNVAVLARDAASGFSLSRMVAVSLRKVPPAPFVISGAAFIDEPLPAGTVHPSTKVTVSGSLQSLVPGVPSEVELSWTSDVVVESLYITVRNFTGYYILPVTAGKTGQVTVTVTLPVSATQSVTSSPGTNSAPGTSLRDGEMCLDTSFLFDFSGAAACFDPLYVDAGVGRIVLRWSSKVDLDLFVTEPDGDVISYNSPVSRNGGAIDLDANYNCEPTFTMNAPTESVVWQTGNLAAGQYTLKVKLSNACNGPGGTLSTDPLASAVSFNGSYTECDGSTKTFSGTIPAGTKPGTLTAAVATYTLTGCDVWVRGGATYKKYKPLTRTSQMMPLTRAKVSALKSSDNSVLATGYTDAYGGYGLNFKGDSSQYYLKVEAIREPLTKGGVSQVEVIDNAGKRQEWRTPDLGTNQSLEHNIAVIDNAKNGKRAGAFNVMQIVGKGFDFATTMVGKQPTYTLKVHWQYNTESTVCQTCYSQASSGTMDDVYVGGKVADPDEFDDPVLLHEFYHSVVGRMSHDDSPGGNHTLSGRYDPLLAWSEGSATFFGCYMNGSSVYFDSMKSSVSKTDLETWYDKHKTGIVGTAGNTLTGNLSEALVFCALWDLYDGKDNKAETYDKIDGQLGNITNSVFKYITNKLPANDRGVTGADFVDFLDGYRCQYYTAGTGFGDESDLKTLIKHFAFPYDYPAALTCN